MQRKIALIGILISIFYLPSFSVAENVDLKELSQSIQELKSLVVSLQSTVTKQQSAIEALQSENRSLRNTVAISPPSPNSQVSDTPPVASTTSTTSKGTYLPEIGVIADIVGFSTESKEDGEGNDKVSVRDLEIVFGHDIDPYARLDATVVFSDTEDPELEEAYATFWDLPLDTKLRLGRLKPKIGQAAAIHRDSLDTVDVPVVVQRYFGAEGFSKSGVELSGYTPLASDFFTQEVLLGVIEGGNGEEGQLFGDARRIPTFYARLRHGVEISDTTNFDLGLNWLNGSTDDDSGREANAVGADFVLTHFVTPRSKFKLQSEFYMVDRDRSSEEESSAEEEGVSYLDEDRPWGYYVLADYRLNERWALGTRWDWVQPIASELTLDREDEQAIAGYMTFYQSEFSRWRLQYQHALLIDDSTDDRLYLQATFAIGTHKHQLQ